MLIPEYCFDSTHNASDEIGVGLASLNFLRVRGSTSRPRICYVRSVDEVHDRLFPQSLTVQFTLDPLNALRPFSTAC